ncbi:hypothetical protein ABZ866_26065, partial [Streptomyces erythrochromogenes]
ERSPSPPRHRDRLRREPEEHGKTASVPRASPQVRGRLWRRQRVLIRQAAITAICDGTERITKRSLEAIRLDHLAENHHRPRRNR